MKKVKVNENCIGCGQCTGIAPDVFEFNDLGLASVKEDLDMENINEENVIDASESCPVDAIEVE